MIVVLKQNPNRDQLESLIAWLQEKGIIIHTSIGEAHTILGLVGDTSQLDIDLIAALDIVEDVKRVQEPYKNANRKFHPEDTVVQVGNTQIGGGNLTLMAGPCSVESEEQVVAIAKAVKASGATMLRGGAFKPRTSPYTFGGLGAEGLELLCRAGRETGLPVVSEITDPRQLPLFREVDVLQVGARNMQNFELLRELGRQEKPVLLKRSFGATVTELLQAAEYILAGGNERVILCERGIRTFETDSRATLDVAGIAALKEQSHLPVLADPSHAAGRRELVTPLALAAAAAGADGLMIEVHDRPAEALSDGRQALTCGEFARLARRVQALTALLRQEE